MTHGSPGLTRADRAEHISDARGDDAGRSVADASTISSSLYGIVDAS